MPRPFHSLGLTAKKPKKYAGLVERCQHLNVPDMLAPLSPEERRTRAVYVPPEHPGVALIRTRKGALPFFWYVVCARCRRRCEALHRPLWAQPGDWRCVRCHGLTYASRRHGKSEQSVSRQMHRRNPAYRTRQRIARERDKAMREAARVRRERDRLARPQRRAAERDRLAVAKALPDLLARVKDKAIIVEATPGKPGTCVLDYDALMAAEHAKREREKMMRGVLAADAEANAAVLARYSPRSRALKAQAARVLGRLAAVYGV